MQADSQNIENYLNLGRVYLRAGLKTKAIETFRKGLEVDKNPEIMAELQVLGIRKKPIFPFLPRSHFLNKYLGLVISKVGKILSKFRDILSELRHILSRLGLR